VTFDIDANGILNVTAQDKATGRSQHITITASSGLDEKEVERMRHEAEAHAEEDKRHKELIEVRNHADNLIYSAEKTLKDSGAKVQSDLKTQVEDKVKALRERMNGEDVQAIRSASDELGKVLEQLGASMYQQQPGVGGSGQPGGGSGPDQGNPPSDDSGEVVDGEFTSE
ncbi:MAG: Hsp70 family protein, partial [Chloroflexi bacterium]|nr:Hsp70 family protein [Chloroflexota bacterium]